MHTRLHIFTAYFHVPDRSTGAAVLAIRIQSILPELRLHGLIEVRLDEYIVPFLYAEFIGALHTIFCAPATLLQLSCSGYVIRS